MAARSQESARLFAKKFNIPYAYNSYKQLTQHQDIGEYTRISQSTGFH